MLIEFKQSVHIGKKHFKPGVHDVSDEVLQDKYFLLLVKSGWVADVEQQKIISPLSFADRQAALAERILKNPSTRAALSSGAAAAPVASEEQVDEVLSAVSEAEDIVEEQESEEKVSKKSKKAKR